MEDNPTGPAPSASLPAQVPSTPAKPSPTFVGNSNDVVAVVAATAAAISSICCISFGYGIYCLPLVGVLLGLVAIINAKASMNPDRTRRWGWISVGVSGAVLLVILAAIALFIAFYGAIIAAALAGAQYLPTPTPSIH